MLYTEDFTMRHYVGFSQIGSHIWYLTHSCELLEIIYGFNGMWLELIQGRVFYRLPSVILTLLPMSAILSV